MERILENDLAAKVLALLLAFLLWLRVSGELPPVQKQVTGVPVRVINVPAGLAVVGVEPESVTVYVRGRGRALDRANRDELAAVVDVRRAPPGRTAYAVENVNVPRGVTLVDVRPARVVVALEQLEERQLPVAVRVTGRVAAGFRAGAPVAEPRRVSARGLRRDVRRVAGLAVDVAVDGADADVERVRPVRAVDSQGRIVEGVELVPPEVTVRVPVSQEPPPAPPQGEAPGTAGVTPGAGEAEGGYVIVQGDAGGR